MQTHGTSLHAAKLLTDSVGKVVRKLSLNPQVLDLKPRFFTDKKRACCCIVVRMYVLAGICMCLHPAIAG